MSSDLEHSPARTDTQHIVLRGCGNYLAQLFITTYRSVHGCTIFSPGNKSINRQSFECACTGKGKNERLAFIQAGNLFDGFVDLPLYVNGCTPLVATLFDELLHFVLSQGNQRLAVRQQAL